MSGFRALLCYGSVSIWMGTVTSLTITPNKRTSTTPIPSQPSQNSFPVELGNSLLVQLMTTRCHPDDYDDDSSDSSEWSNKAWYEAVTSLVDRWQMRTDGVDLKIYPDDSTDPNVYFPVRTYHGYVKTSERTYSVGSPTLITSSLTLVIGTMYVGTTVPSDAVPMSGMFVMMSDSSCTNWFAISYYGDGSSTYDKYNCMDSMTITGGSESPFETVTLKIPKKKLSEQIPLLYGDIVGQKNRIYLNTLGKGRMIVTQVRSDSSSYTVTACTEAWFYKNYNVTSPLAGTPFNIIMQILIYGGYGVIFSKDSFHYRYNPAYDVEGYEISLGTNVWRALQILATCLGCKIFFADNEAWLVDYRHESGVTYEESDNGWGKYFTGSGDDGLIDLYSTKMCVGEATFDEEGSYPLTNAVDAVCLDSDGNAVTASYVDSASVNVFGEANRQRIYVTELTEDNDHAQGTAFAKGYVSYRAEPQRSVTFTFKELYKKSGAAAWSSYFGCSACARGFIDSVNGDKATNDSVTVEGTKCYQKMVLSSYTRSYPKGTCEYTFGTIANIDLSSSTSELNNRTQ